jgi:hypothetical protein
VVLLGVNTKLLLTLPEARFEPCIVVLVAAAEILEPEVGRFLVATDMSLPEIGVHIALFG